MIVQSVLPVSATSSASGPAGVNSDSSSADIENRLKTLRKEITNLQSLITEETQSGDDADIKQKKIEAMQVQIQQLELQIERLQRQQNQQDKPNLPVEPAASPKDDSERNPVSGMIDLLI